MAILGKLSSCFRHITTRIFHMLGSMIKFREAIKYVFVSTNHVELVLVFRIYVPFDHLVPLDRSELIEKYHYKGHWLVHHLLICTPSFDFI